MSLRTTSFFVLLLTVSLTLSNVIGIDFGSNFISVGLLSTGKPITIIRNENEKRITPALVSIDGRERFLGTRAVSKSSRRSNVTANNIIQLLGRSEMPPNLAFPYPLPPYEYDGEKGTLVFNHGEGLDKLPVQDLAALILQSMQRITLKTQSVNITNCVITVPSYYAQSQRQAILDAAKIANLNVLALIESTIAAAYQFGMERSRTMAKAFEEGSTATTNTTDGKNETLTEESATRNVLFVDMGGSQLTMSLVHYEFPRPNNTETNRHMTRKEKAMEAKRKKEEEEARKKKAAEMKEEEEEEDDDDDDDEGIDEDATDVMSETPEELEQRKRAESGLNGEEEEEEEDEDDPTKGTITINSQADLDAYMRKQNEWQKKRQAKEEAKKKKWEIKTVKKSKRAKSRRARLDARGASFDQSRFIGRMEVLLSTTDESLGGRQVDSLLANYLLAKYHQAAAPEEYKKYGECRPYVYASQAEEDALMKKEAELSPAVLRHLRTPQNPRLHTFAANNTAEALEEEKKHIHKGEKCQRLLNNPMVKTLFMKTASSAKEMLSVAPEWRGSIDDVLPELPEYKVTLTKKEFEDIAKPVFDHFRQVVKRFLSEYDLFSDRMKKGIEADMHGNQIHLFDLAGVAPINSIVVQLMGGSMRIPALQDILLEEFQAELDRHPEANGAKVELGRLLNVDEAAAFGSTMYAATLIPRYSVKGVMLVEHAKRRISMKITNNDDTPVQKSDKNEFRLPSKKSPLYEKGLFYDPNVIFVDDDVTDVDVIPVGTPLPCQKTIIIPRSCPYTLTFNYPLNTDADVAWTSSQAVDAATPSSTPLRLPSLPLPDGVSPHIISVNVTGSGGSLSMFTSPVDWCTRVTVEVGKDGVFRVKKATLEVATPSAKKEEEEKVVKDDEEVETEEDDDDKKQKKEEEKTESTTTSSSSTSSDAEGKKKKYVRRRMAIEIHTIRRGAPGEAKGPTRYMPLSKKDIKHEQNELADFDAFEKEKEELAEIRNAIEAYVFEMKEKFEIQRDDILAIAEESQLEAAQEALEETGLWLDTTGADLLLPTSPVPESEQVEGQAPRTPLEVLKTHLEQVKEACVNISTRLAEQTAFPKAAVELKKMVEKMREKQDDAVSNEQMSEDEADEMEKHLQDALDWLKEKSREVMNTPKGAYPPITSEEVAAHMKDVEKEANDAIANAAKRVRQEKYEKEKKLREERKKKEKERLLKEKRRREEEKMKKVAKEGYEELLENQDDFDEAEDGSKSKQQQNDEDDENEL